MTLATRTVTAFKEEGIEEVANLEEYFKDDTKAIFEKLRKPVFQEDPTNNTKMKQVAGYHVSAKSQKRLLVAVDAVCYYLQVGCVLMSDNMD